MRKIALIFLLIIPTMISAETSLKDLYKRGYINLEKKLDITNDTLKGTDYMTSFGNYDVAVDGNIYITDYKACKLVLLNKEGNLIKAVGQKGKGPGDLTGPSRPVIYEKQITIIEMVSRKASVFRTDGSFIRHIKHGKFLFIKNLIPLSKDKYLIHIYNMGFNKAMGKQRGTIYIYDKDFNEIKQIYTRELLLNTYSARSNHPQPYAADISCALNINGDIVTGYQADEKVNIFRKNKKIEFKHNIKQIPITNKDKKKFFEGLSFTDGSGKTQEVPKEFIKTTVFPKLHPYFMKIVTDSEGNILLFSNENHFYSYDMNGKFINRVEISDYFHEIGM